MPQRVYHQVYHTLNICVFHEGSRAVETVTIHFIACYPHRLPEVSKTLQAAINGNTKQMQLFEVQYVQYEVQYE